ncbi:MAG TPA: L-seryl-tRNA(Sec) selenium transferase [Chloroflexi bacterium]|nr:L-seryl-tRNA(Sec) selenium transferase [Chloroflexota bacterium]
MSREELRKLPSVDELLKTETLKPLIEEYGHDNVVEAVREAMDQARKHILAGEPCPPSERLAEDARALLLRWLSPSIRPVINATGVIIHTNLGRAPLSAETRAAMEAVARGYSNLEFDLEQGRRGSRYVHAEELLTRLTGAEAALVVNNNAGAVLLVLSALARGREVVISRSQLVEIGGGFRIPDVMRQSGATLVEVGTTNRTYLRDYEEAITENTAIILRAHRSNFRITGFTHDVPLEELVELGHRHGLYVMDDLGSGALLDTSRYGLAHEPMVQESIAAGADVVCFSGDKLLGGPQGGIIVGRREIIERLKRFPLTRALRVDKTTLAGLQATLLHYIKGEAEQKVPVWRMMAAAPAELKRRAQRWARRLKRAGIEACVIEGRSTVGGGSLPGETLPTWLLALSVPSPDAAARALRSYDPPIIARIEEDLLLFDPRTVFPEEEETLLRGIVAVLTTKTPRHEEK